MNNLKRLSMLIIILLFLISANVFSARQADEIEVYKIGNTAITVKWTPYNSGGLTIEKYVVGHRIHGAAAYDTIDVTAGSSSIDYNSINNEFSKRITGLTSNTIYDIKIDVMIEGNAVPVVYYDSIMVTTKTIIDSEVQTISNPYGSDTVGHVDFAYTAPNIDDGSGNAISLGVANITGYNLIVSASEGQIYSGGQPYKVLYNNGTSKYDIYRVTTAEDALTYNGTQFSFASQVKDGKDLLAFALYKTNQPSTDNFTLASVYYVIAKPIFKVGTAYENVITTATANYETIETISTLLPLNISQVSNDLIKLQFDSAGSGSVTYDIYKGRLPSTLVKTHKEYDDGTRGSIQYFNKLEDPLEGDVYYFKVVCSNGVISKISSITITLNPNVAPIISNISAERIITDTVDDYSDVIISWDKPANEDVNRANLFYKIYLNTDSLNQVYDSDVVHDTTGNIQLDTDGKIMLNTKKDINNNNILFNGLPVVFERIADIEVATLSDPATVYSGNNPIGNFMSTGCNYYRITRNGQQVVRTMYRINGENFLNNADVPQVSGDPHTIYVSRTEGELATDYKGKIELNTAYYLKFDTYNSSNTQTSDYSLTISFTTPTDTVDTIPAPENLTASAVQTTSIDLIWNPINSSLYNDADVTYELFISENGGYSTSDFYRIKNPTIGVVGGKKHVSLSSYTLDDDVAKTIAQNSVYLFKVRAIWATKDSNNNSVNIYSNLSEILPVTTKRTTISDPDMTAPPAPVDFEATNVTSKSASFSWAKVDQYSTYRIVKTSQPIDAFAPLSTTGNGVATGFVLGGSTYTYTDSDLVSNTLYYFSIRSEVEVDTVDGSGNPIQITLSSSWISIPITTILVEEPTELTLVSRTDTGHSVTISWKGKANLDYATVTKEDGTTNYVANSTVSGEAGNSSLKTFQLLITGLKSNTKYLVKVRAKDPVGNMYSRYTEPIEVRTEFCQSDYDSYIENKEETEIITNDGQEWLKSPIEEIGSDTKRFEVWVKNEKTANLISNSPQQNYEIDLNQKSSTTGKIANISVDVIAILNDMNKNLEINTGKTIINIKPDIIDDESLSDLLNNSTIKSRMIKIQINELTNAERTAAITTSDYIASSANNITLKVVGYSKTEEELNTLISQKIDEIIDDQVLYIGSKTIEQIREQCNSKIKEEIKKLMLNYVVADKSIGLNNSKIKIICDLNYNDTGKIDRYIGFVKGNNLQKEFQGIVIDNNKFEFQTDILGTFIILGKISAEDILGHQAEDDIRTLLVKYDFSNEITNGKFRPNETAKREDVINFILNCLAPLGDEYEGMTCFEKAKEIGLAEGMQTWSLTGAADREELAYLLGRLYYIKTGVAIDELSMSSNVEISDEDSINSKYKNSVSMLVGNDILQIFSNKYFYPAKQVTRAEAMTSIVELLKYIGEIN